MPPDSSLSVAARLWLAFACFWRVLLDGSFAERVRAVTAGSDRPTSEPPPPPELPAAPPEPPADRGLALLSLLQREGRLVDFLEQDIVGFSDADVGAAARVVHDGCRKVLRGHAKLAPVRPEEEGTRVTVANGFSPSEIRLTGNVQGAAPFTGTLRHRGWRATDFRVPTAVQGSDPSVLAPAEVEL
jgi:hypothetical protein